jgi:hypothetical protein
MMIVEMWCYNSNRNGSCNRLANTTPLHGCWATGLLLLYYSDLPSMVTDH